MIIRNSFRSREEYRMEVSQVYFENADLFCGRVTLLQFSDAAVVGMQVNQATSNDRGNGCTVHLSSVKWRVSAFRLRTIYIENPFKLWIENREVRVRM